MASKNDLVRALRRTEELARQVGLIEQDEALFLEQGEAQFNIPWGVRKMQDGYRYEGALPFLPDSGRSIGMTKSEALQTLQTVNGTLSVVLRTPRPVRNIKDMIIA